jgi:hypothetical protein
LAILVGSGRETPGVFIIIFLAESVSGEKITNLPLRGRVGVAREHVSRRVSDEDGKFFLYSWLDGDAPGFAVSGPVTGGT